MTPPVKFKCEYCDHRGLADTVTVVTLTVVDLCEIAAYDQAHTTCPKCGMNNVTSLCTSTAELLVEVGFPHAVIDPPYEPHHDHGPWTDDHVAQAAALAWVHDDVIWDELDAHIEGEL